MPLWIWQQVQALSRAAGLIRAAARGVLALYALFMLASIAVAQDVTLTSRDGGIEVSGALIGYDGEFYRIRSEYGDLTLDGSGVNCSGPGCPDLSSYVAEITFSGPGLLTKNLMPGLFAAFARSERYELDVSDADGMTEFAFNDPVEERVVARFQVETVSNAEAFAHLLSGRADMVLATRAVLPDENALAIEAGLGNLAGRQQSRVVALDGIVPVVSARNPARRVTIEDLIAAFSGEMPDWRDITGVDAPIYLHLLSGDRAERVAFLERMLLPTDRNYAGLLTLHDSASEMLDAVARDPFALGLARMSDTGGTRVLEVAGDCGFARDADNESLKSEDYPLPAPLFLYQRGGRMPRIARELLSFLDTPAAQIAITRAGLVDQGMVRTEIRRQGDRLANAIRNASGSDDLATLRRMVDEMTDYARLSMSFRFEADDRGLDGQSQSNVRLLGRALESGTLGARDILFVGFSDTVEGQEDRSVERAQEVEQRVLNAAATLDRRSVSVRSIGFGDIMPLACGDQPWGVNLNRRVEVWVR